MRRTQEEMAADARPLLAFVREVPGKVVHHSAQALKLFSSGPGTLLGMLKTAGALESWRLVIYRLAGKGIASRTLATQLKSR